MTPYDMIKQHLDAAVPFARHVGVELLEIGDGTASAALEQREDVSNHIQSMHAGAMFTLAEAASGAALAGAFGPAILQLRPVAKTADIAFRKVALGRLTAQARATAASASAGPGAPASAGTARRAVDLRPARPALFDIDEVEADLAAPPVAVTAVVDEAETVAAPGSWTPAPVPPPTYTLKAKAYRGAPQPSTGSAELPADGTEMALEEEFEDLPQIHRVG